MIRYRVLYYPLLIYIEDMNGHTNYKADGVICMEIKLYPLINHYYLTLSLRIVTGTIRGKYRSENLDFGSKLNTQKCDAMVVNFYVQILSRHIRINLNRQFYFMLTYSCCLI
jgi:hypothetical protein